MATLKEYFGKDFFGYISLENSVLVNDAGGQKIGNLLSRRHIDFALEAQFSSFYVEWKQAGEFQYICQHYCMTEATALGFCSASTVQLNRGVRIPFGEKVEIRKDSILGNNLLFLYYRGRSSRNFSLSKRVYVYSNKEPSKKLVEDLKELYKFFGLDLTIRSTKYMEEQNTVQKPDAFLSHDSRDKDLAREIATELQKEHLRVWYDEFSLKPGDRLRESIERGLKDCKCCILLLTDNFLSNSGWTKTEFNSIFTREILESTDYLIPIWKDVSTREVFEYSPALSDRIGVIWSKEGAMGKLVGAVHSRKHAAGDSFSTF